jgi:hypothetical protein
MNDDQEKMKTCNAKISLEAPHICCLPAGHEGNHNSQICGDFSWHSFESLFQEMMNGEKSYCDSNRCRCWTKSSVVVNRESYGTCCADCGNQKLRYLHPAPAYKRAQPLPFVFGICRITPFRWRPKGDLEIRLEPGKFAMVLFRKNGVMEVHAIQGDDRFWYIGPRQIKWEQKI